MQFSTIRLVLIFISLFLLKNFYAEAQTILPDNTFGTNGLRMMYDSIYNTPTCMDIQPDGKAVVGMSGNYVAIARYNADGSVDTAFGGHGFRMINNYGYSDKITAIKILPSGKILACGEEHTGAIYTNFIVRLTAAGAIDSTFGTAGFTIVSTLQYTFGDLKVLSTGSIRYLFYNTAMSASAFSPAVMALDSSGAIDHVFGTKTISRIVSGSTTAMYNLDHNDRLIIVGRDSNAVWVLGRMLPDGSFDNTFGNAGFATINTIGTNSFTNHPVNNITTAVEPDNSIVAAMHYNSTNGDIFAAHILANGTQDNSFGQGGLATIFTNTTSANHNLVGALAMNNGDVLVTTSYNFNAGTFIVYKSIVQALTATGQNAPVFANQTDSMEISYDTQNGTGTTETVTGNLVKVPGHNQLMLFASTATDNRRYLARFLYSGFVAGINQPQAALDFEIFPNPASAICFVHLSENGAAKNYTARLFDLTGNEVAGWNLTGGINTFSTAGFAKGFYVLRVTDEAGSATAKKLVVQ